MLAFLQDIWDRIISSVPVQKINLWLNSSTGIKIAVLIAIALLYIVWIARLVTLFSKKGIPVWKAFVPFLNTMNMWKAMSDVDTYWGLELTGGFLVFLGLVFADDFGLIIFCVGILAILGFHVYNMLRSRERNNESKGLWLLDFLLVLLLVIGKFVLFAWFAPWIDGII